MGARSYVSVRVYPGPSGYSVYAALMAPGHPHAKTVRVLENSHLGDVADTLPEALEAASEALLAAARRLRQQ